MKYDNAFIAVGLDREDVVIETLRADFAGILRSWVKNEGYTQSQAGKRLGVGQAVISEIMNGNTDKRSVEYLIRLIERAGLTWAARRGKGEGVINVVAGPPPFSWSAVGSQTILLTLNPVGESTGVDAHQALHPTVFTLERKDFARMSMVSHG
jgi:predicted XRE-type DNA-binding protein